MTEIIIKYRWLIVGLCLALAIVLGSLIPSSQTDPEIRNYIPESMASRVETDKIENEFGVQDMVMIIFTDSSILTAENLKQIKSSDRDISKLTGVTSRTSPFTVRTITSSEGMMVADLLIRRIPADTAGLIELREEILNNKFARDIVVSSDMTSASITANINDAETENVTIHKIDSITSAHSGTAKVLQGGLPYIRQRLMKDVRKDAILLVPLALIVMLVVLKFSLGEWKSVMLVFSVVLLSTAVCMGMIPLLGWKMSIITLLVPIILIAVANNYGIYLVARYQELSTTHHTDSKTGIIKELLGSLNMPILFSGLTTIAGILGLLSHSIIPARQVGMLAAAGVAVALVMSLTMIPALIYIRGNAKKPGAQVKTNTAGFDRFLGRLAAVIVRYPGRFIAGFILVTLVFASGIFLLKIETNQEKYFPKKNPLRMASDAINSKFGGSQTISVMITGNIKDPVIMQGIDRLTSEVKNIDGVGQVFSISLAVREMSKAIFSPGETGYDQIPGSGEAIAQMFELYNMSGDPDDFSQMMNLDNTRAHVLIRLSNPENDIIRNVRAKIDEITKDIPAEITTGGYAMIMSEFASSVIKGQLSSLLIALLTVFVLLALIFRSFRGGLIGTIPLAVSIVLLFGFMGFTGIALDAATALLSSIMIGVGVDFTIQYIWCFNSYISKGFSYEESLTAAMRTIGRSIIINAFTVMAGFSVLILSGFTSIRFFGYLVIISIGSCLAGALILIPAILVKFRPQFAEMEMNRKRNKIKDTRKKKQD
ncbi:MAG: efflux RND transporter permease subunit [Bacteroidota bacterium]